VARISDLPRCGLCDKLVTCFRWASDDHRQHKSCVLCSGCANALDELSLIFTIVSANERNGIDTVVRFNGISNIP